MFFRYGRVKQQPNVLGVSTLFSMVILYIQSILYLPSHTYIRPMKNKNCSRSGVGIWSPQIEVTHNQTSNTSIGYGKIYEGDESVCYFP
uniref:Uncharacterized protein n=1 Tax=Lactuca sativa TaxID=4236 RepID=A0A9R1UW00_LACSA|nr:hypothetical protein LSAT_V11C800430620 [Lactuca sativa]